MLPTYLLSKALSFAAYFFRRLRKVKAYYPFENNLHPRINLSLKTKVYFYIYLRLMINNRLPFIPQDSFADTPLLELM